MSVDMELSPKPKRPPGEPCCEPVVYPDVERQQAQRMAEVAKALGDPVRLQLVDVLRKHAGKVCVCELVPLFDVSQPTVSHHLKKLGTPASSAPSAGALGLLLRRARGAGGVVRMAELRQTHRVHAKAQRRSSERANEGRAAMANALFVCLHNAGRSQMSAALFARAAAGRHQARSAGTTPGERVHPEVVEAMAELGIDLSDRRPKLLTSADAEWADVVVTMGCGDSSLTSPVRATSTGTCPIPRASRSRSCGGPGTRSIGASTLSWRNWTKLSGACTPKSLCYPYLFLGKLVSCGLP